MQEHVFLVWILSVYTEDNIFDKTCINYFCSVSSHNLLHLFTHLTLVHVEVEQTSFNPPYSDGFSKTHKCNKKDRIVYYISLGVTGQNFLI